MSLNSSVCVLWRRKHVQAVTGLSRSSIFCGFLRGYCRVPSRLVREPLAGRKPKSRPSTAPESRATTTRHSERSSSNWSLSARPEGRDERHDSAPYTRQAAANTR